MSAGTNVLCIRTQHRVAPFAMTAFNHMPANLQHDRHVPSLSASPDAVYTVMACIMPPVMFYFIASSIWIAMLHMTGVI